MTDGQDEGAPLAAATLPWDDLIYVLAIARGKSLAGAARLLRVSHSTAVRRLQRLEESLGVRLFERLQEGCIPTPAGDAAIAAAERVDSLVAELQRKVASHAVAEAGSLRLTTTEDLVPVVAPLCAEFVDRFPHVRLELLGNNERMSLARRQADVALRPSNDPGDSLRGRRVADIPVAVHVPRGHVCGEREACRWIGFSPDMGHLAAATWIERNIDPELVLARASSFTAAAALALSCSAHCLLPCYIGARSEGLSCAGAAIAALDTPLWLLVHPDLSGSPRVRLFLDYVGDQVAQLRQRLIPPAG